MLSYTRFLTNNYDEGRTIITQKNYVKYITKPYKMLSTKAGLVYHYLNNEEYHQKCHSLFDDAFDEYSVLAKNSIACHMYGINEDGTIEQIGYSVLFSMYASKNIDVYDAHLK
jgi:hypothetical protein